MPTTRRVIFTLFCLAVASAAAELRGQARGDRTVRVFVFAGQSNMEGADSKVADIERFLPYRGFGDPQPEVRFWYAIGRESKAKSEGWVPLQPVRGMVGPELSFARRVAEHVRAPLAIIKVAAGGTHLGGDWNPDEPTGFEMYPLLLETVREALAALDRAGVRYRLEGFCWHQGENDMFDEGYRAHYGANLANFVASVRRDLDAPELRFYVGELCTKTIWGMDLRPRMHEISVGQRSVTDADPLCDYVPTSHVGVEIGGGVGLHYHYGTLGQLQHGENYARAYLDTRGLAKREPRELARWPFEEGATVRLHVLAGHRNMEGERAFEQELAALPGGSSLLRDDHSVPYRYDLGGGYHVSNGWEPLGATGYYGTFGPELSFARALRRRDGQAPIAIAKFTHSGSQIIDWTPEGSVATTRNLYPEFLAFVRESIASLEAKGHQVELAGIHYHVGENDMSWGPFRRGAAERVEKVIRQLREDLAMPELRWFVSQQPPTDDPSVSEIDVTGDLLARAEKDPHWIHLHELELPPQEKKLVLDTRAMVALGRILAQRWIEAERTATGK